ncbi:MAG: L-serine ammonia-lyase, iron-sulfur-dependent subunit beta [Synergistales bacterium]|nr:L-serine ammonia-lyase, iron-sulfur-dependent subunit beta [Synergistales bacterium]
MLLEEIIGPVMIGPSSSHTAGAARLGKLARTCWGTTEGSVEIYLRGSFATTGKGHGTDRALLAGLMGMDPDDPQIRSAYQVAEERQLVYTFHTEEVDGAHPNSARFVFRSGKDEGMEVLGASVGGGAVELQEIDGFRLRLTGELPTLVTFHRDSPGVASVVTSVLTGMEINIATPTLARKTRGGLASMAIEMDAGTERDVADRVRNAHPSLLRVLFLAPEGGD